MKKILSFAVALVMLLTMSIPMASAIYDGAPDTVGTVESGYTPTGNAVSNVDEFVAMETGGTYYLTEDLDFSGTTYTASIWNKTGDLNLDGCGHSLTGITINGTGDVGVFCDLRNGTIKNLNVEATITTGTGACAGLTALSKSGTTNFENVKLNVNIKGGKIGGFCGYAEGGTINIYNSEVNGKIDGSTSSKTGENGGVGGFLGQMKKAGVIEFCTNKATVLGNNTCTGGFIGRVVYGFRIDDSINKGTVDNSSASGGDCGTAGFIGTTQCYGGNPQATQVQGCWNDGEIKGGRDTAGIVGASQGDWQTAKTIIIKGCKNTGSISGGLKGGAKIAGIIAEARYGLNVKECINEGSVTGYAGQYEDDGVGAIVGGAYNSSVNATWTLEDNENYGIITNTKAFEKGTSKVSTLVGYTASVTITTTEGKDNTSTTKAVGTLATAGKAYIQFAEADTTSDVRFILALDETAVSSISEMNLTITIGEVTVNLNTFGTLYRTLNASDLDIKGGDGVVLYGLIVTGVPNDVWSTISIALSATDSTGTAIDALTVSGSYSK